MANAGQVEEEPADLEHPHGQHAEPELIAFGAGLQEATEHPPEQ